MTRAKAKSLSNLQNPNQSQEKLENSENEETPPVKQRRKSTPRRGRISVGIAPGTSGLSGKKSEKEKPEKLAVQAEDEVDSEEDQETPPHAKARSRRSGILGRLVGSCASVKEKSSTSPRKLRSRSKGKSKKLAKKYVFKYFC